MRPTPEQLQTALTVADQSRPPHYVAVLAAEVRALQRELDLFRTAGEAAELRVVELREEVKFATARADDNEATVRRLMAAIARLDERDLAAEVRALRESERVAWDNVNFPTLSNFVHCYPHKTAWVRGAPDEGCSACKLERELNRVRELGFEGIDREEAMCAIIDRIEMLPAKWRTVPLGWVHECAADLEQALRGEP